MNADKVQNPTNNMQLPANIKLQDGKYRIIRVLGQGGFGITYLAEHTMLDKMVAIKEFFPKEYCDRNKSTNHLTIGTKSQVEIVEMLKTKFIKEAKNISKLNHKNIITIYDIFQENHTAYYVMEYIEGVSLAQMVKEHGALPESKAVGYIMKVGEAVGYMHSLSMNHLDLKPANIMIRSADDEPILIDFGLSKQYDTSGTQTSTTPIGISHGFAPIEQYRPGGVSTFTPQTDIYALGATLYNLLSGSVPPHYSDIIENGLPPLPITVSKPCADAVCHAMEINRNNRPAKINEFLSEISKAETKEPLLELTLSEETQLIHVTTHKSKITPHTELANYNHSTPTNTQSLGSSITSSTSEKKQLIEETSQYVPTHDYESEARQLRDKLAPGCGGLLCACAATIVVGIIFFPLILYTSSDYIAWSIILFIIILFGTIFSAIKLLDNIHNKRIQSWKEEHPYDPRSKYL